jgi:hypothetical protein
MINYQHIAKAVALRSNQIEGGDAAAREAAYAAADISASMDGVEVPYSALKQDILAAEAELASAIGMDPNSVYRSSLMGESSNLVNESDVPVEDDAGVQFVGMFDGVYDASDNKVLRRKPVEVVQRRIDNPGGFWVRDAYAYAVEGTVLLHTRQSVYFRGCVWDRDTQDAMYDLQSVSPLPQELAVLWADLVLMGLPQEGWFQTEAELFASRVRARWRQFFPGQPPHGQSLQKVTPIKD